MILDQIGRQLEPVSAQLIEHIALFRNRWVQYVVERRDAVGNYDEIMLSQIIQLSNFSFIEQRCINIIHCRGHSL
ncbi:hypothetical protein D3C80_1937710 [compost metagenome]